MKKNECSLCGGKLRNGICIECGMDSRKSDKNYESMLNKGICDEAELSHVHEENGAAPYQPSYQTEAPRQASMARQRQASSGGAEASKQKQAEAIKQPKQRTAEGTEWSKQTPAGDAERPRIREKPKKNGKTLTIFLCVCLTVFVVFIPIIFLGQRNKASSPEQISKKLDPFQDYSDEEDFDSYEEYEEYEEYDPFASVEEALKETGETWEAKMDAGFYVVGVDIPEGEYAVGGYSGSSFEVLDKEHALFTAENFEAAFVDMEINTGIKLFTGAVVNIKGMYPVALFTENGQVQDMQERQANPVQAVFEFTGQAKAGEDFPAGTYDVEATGEGFGVFYFEVEPYGEDISYPFSRSALMEANPTEEYPGYSQVYKNIVLPEGSMVSADGFQVRLTPSQGITTSDYASYYENMQ